MEQIKNLYPTMQVSNFDLEKMRQQMQKDYAPIREKFGNLNDFDCQQVFDAEQDLKMCESCKGFPCQHKHWKNLKSTVTTGSYWREGVSYPTVYVTYTPCKYALAEERQQRFEKNFKSSKLPKKYIGKTFSDYEVTADNKKAVDAAKEFLKNPSQGLRFYSMPGRGKTFLAAIIAQEFLKLGHTVIFGDVPSILDDLKNTFDKDGDKKTFELMDALETVDLLILDDLGTETPTEWAVERLYLIINQRYNAEKPIIVTTNYKAQELEMRLNNPKNKAEKMQSVTGSRIVSRILEMCKGVELKGNDRRIRQ